MIARESLTADILGCGPRSQDEAFHTLGQKLYPCAFFSCLVSPEGSLDKDLDSKFGMGSIANAFVRYVYAS